MKQKNSLVLQIKAPGDADWSTLSTVALGGTDAERERTKASIEKQLQRWQANYLPFMDAKFRIIPT